MGVALAYGPDVAEARQRAKRCAALVRPVRPEVAVNPAGIPSVR